MTTQDNDQRSSVASQFPFFGSRTAGRANAIRGDSPEEGLRTSGKPPKWSFGVLNDPETIEVPGSVLLLPGFRNEPVRPRNAPGRTSSPFPSGVIQEPAPPSMAEVWSQVGEKKKTTSDGQIILEPQPEDSANDPLNWPGWRRDLALVSLGLYCMVGGGMTPVLAAGFTDVADEYGVSVSRVALTTGLYMMGMGLGSVIASPTAILYGKRPVYLVSAVLFVITSVWCAVSPNFTSLVLARIFQGMSVSPVECLPSATIAEIFFLHERAFRIGIYTLLLLGGKNLVPLVSAAVMQRLGWRWVFWVVAMVVGFCGVLLFVFVPETFWDRTSHQRPGLHSMPNPFRLSSWKHIRPPKDVRSSPESDTETGGGPQDGLSVIQEDPIVHVPQVETSNDHAWDGPGPESYLTNNGNLDVPREEGHEDQTPQNFDIASAAKASPTTGTTPGQSPPDTEVLSRTSPFPKNRSPHDHLEEQRQEQATRKPYSSHWRKEEAKTFVQQLRPWHGRLNRDAWLKVMIRPLILLSYPSVLWSAVVYSCSVGWLIVLSESVAVIFRQGYYQFSALQTGLVYISPFIGGVLGTAVAGKVSDMIVKAMSRRNGGLYEPEFRLVMALPTAVTTVIGLMGFGWSAQVHDAWIVPTVFFGIVSFGCSLGTTMSITFCVDSYRQYAGEALVTLNFSKNIFHGLVFSLFVTGWLESDGAKMVFIWIGIIQLITLAFSVPMFIYGKRSRMWTVRKDLMETF